MGFDAVHRYRYKSGLLDPERIQSKEVKTGNLDKGVFGERRARVTPKTGNYEEPLVSRFVSQEIPSRAIHVMDKGEPPPRKECEAE